MQIRRRFVLTPAQENPLPLYIETIGDNAHEDQVNRPGGYPFYHWIQTISGEGIVEFEGASLRLPAQTGFFLHPGIPHKYEAATETWETLYVTFGGTAAPEIVGALGLRSAFYRWEPDSPFAPLPYEMLRRVERESDLFGLNGSADVYTFLITLQKYGQSSSISLNVQKLQPLIQWLEQRYADPSIGLDEMAARLNVSVRTLNSLFRDTFGVTPYAYLLHIRIRQAKIQLIRQPSRPVKEIAADIGFRDVSHFTATFRKVVGMPPDRFRKLH